jgi:hypothetical protein
VVCDDNGLATFERFRRQRESQHVFLYAFGACWSLTVRTCDGSQSRRARRPLRACCASVCRGCASMTTLLIPGDVLFQHACRMGLEGIVSKRLGSRYVSGHTRDWLKFKNPAAPAVKRGAEEDWDRGRGA